MKKTPVTTILFGLIAMVASAQTAPDPEAWPSSIDSTKTVHYVSVDDAFTPPSGSWTAGGLQILSGGDQVTSPIRIGGHNGLVVSSQYLNIADPDYPVWADQDTIDILMQVYGDSSVLAANGTPRSYNFLEGTLPNSNLSSPSGGSLPIEAKNSRWNWVFFSITNGIRPDGKRFVGSLASDATGATAYGGVNGGTLRAQNVPSLKVRFVAFGQKGAFGTADQINIFTSGQSCAPEPVTDAVSLDIAHAVTNNLILLNNLDQTVEYANNIGPASDLRRAARVTGSFMNFGILSNYLGLPCNEAKAMKVCVEFYDDPGLAGSTLGPEAYATDNQGGTNVFPSTQLYTTAGSDKWIKVAFELPSVNLQGVNTAPLQGGPRLIFSAPFFVSRYDLGVFRTGTNALAGQDPLPDCYRDPNICAGIYGNSVELDFNNNIQDGLAPGTSGGDQFMVVEPAGPANDQRTAVRPDGNPPYHLNFSLVNEALGPSSQDNAHLAICVTYYDDPALTNAVFWPDAYQSDVHGQVVIKNPPQTEGVTLRGTGRWQQAYLELPDVNFSGVNQGPQAAARFGLTDRIYLTDIKFAVIRPCGPTAGVNPLIGCQPPVLGFGLSGSVIALSWLTNHTDYVVQTTTDLGSPTWTVLPGSPQVVGGLNVVTQAVTGTRFYRLAK
jgi:hypothetical protein